jgi:hypothetical protein
MIDYFSPLSAGPSAGEFRLKSDLLFAGANTRCHTASEFALVAIMASSRGFPMEVSHSFGPCKIQLSLCLANQAVIHLYGI